MDFFGVNYTNTTVLNAFLLFQFWMSSTQRYCWSVLVSDCLISVSVSVSVSDFVVSTNYNTCSYSIHLKELVIGSIQTRATDFYRWNFVDTNQNRLITQIDSCLTLSLTLSLHKIVCNMGFQTMGLDDFIMEGELFCQIGFGRCWFIQTIEEKVYGCILWRGTYNISI